VIWSDLEARTLAQHASDINKIYPTAFITAITQSSIESDPRRGTQCSRFIGNSANRA